ncbi:MAG TPA: hypothetical protein VJV03_02535 [Pyrinomonadaceae bacterium]|nr:hypothetical protein [Pyrinomonadaceae bacterium]
MAGALFALTLFLAASPTVKSQKQKPTPRAEPQLVRTTVKHELRRFPYGGTVTVIGAPAGSISIEGWPRNEVSVSADIELRGHSEQDLAQLAAVNGFILDDEPNHIRILTTGTHDKAYMKAVAKKFPKTLLGLPWRVAYKIRVPMSTDLDISAGRGPITVSGVEGDIRLSATESETKLNLSGGVVAATVAKGSVSLSVSEKSWRRGGADLRVAFGEINVDLPVGFNADIDAEILRTGKIVDGYGALESREKPGLTPQKMKARTGSGGAFFQFTVGDGMVNIRKHSVASSQ